MKTTHAILDGMHRRFNEPINPDVLAFHEGFADIVALMRHFTTPEILQNQIAQTRGDLESESMLGSLALQFGRGAGKRGALRRRNRHSGRERTMAPDQPILPHTRKSKSRTRAAPLGRGGIPMRSSPFYKGAYSPTSIESIPEGPRCSAAGRNTPRLGQLASQPRR